MPATVSELKAKSRKMFDTSLAQQVEAAIDADLASKKTGPELSGGPTAGPSSALTFWFGDELYKSLGEGHFTGRPIVQWNGMDSFILLVNDQNPFHYKTSDGRSIQPQSIPTDGGSTPRLLHGLRKFSPWGYGPAFIIHDWLFAAHRQRITLEHKWSFEESATILAEGIKSLMAVGYDDGNGKRVRLDKDEDTIYLIYKAVLTSFARDIWDQPR